MTTRILGVDVGGVLIDRVADNTDTSFFSDRFLETPAVADAFDTLAHLVRARFGGRAHVVSKCGQRVQQKTVLWLAHHRFHDIVGIPPDRVHFCRQRRDKEPICARLRVTHFIDDRLDVLEHLSTVEHRYLFQPRQKDGQRAMTFKGAITVVQSWRELAARIA